MRHPARLADAAVSDATTGERPVPRTKFDYRATHVFIIQTLKTHEFYSGSSYKPWKDPIQVCPQVQAHVRASLRKDAKPGRKKGSTGGRGQGHTGRGRGRGRGRSGRGAPSDSATPTRAARTSSPKQLKTHDSKEDDPNKDHEGVADRKALQKVKRSDAPKHSVDKGADTDKGVANGRAPGARKRKTVLDKCQGKTSALDTQEDTATNDTSKDLAEKTDNNDLGQEASDEMKTKRCQGSSDKNQKRRAGKPDTAVEASVKDTKSRKRKAATSVEQEVDEKPTSGDTDKNKGKSNAASDKKKDKMSVEEKRRSVKAKASPKKLEMVRKCEEACGRELGCGKCRFAWSGCLICRDPAFIPPQSSKHPSRSGKKPGPVDVD